MRDRAFGLGLVPILLLPVLLRSVVAGGQDEPPPKPAPPDPRAELFALIDALALEAVEKEGVPGLSIGVGKDSEFWLARGWGYADAKSGATASGDTSYAIGSLTKQLTAVGILQLVDEGKLRLDDETSKLLPELPMQGRKVTLRHLLSDTSGIPGPARLEARKLAAPAKAADKPAERPPQQPFFHPPVVQDPPKPPPEPPGGKDPEKKPAEARIAPPLATEKELFALLADAPFDFEPGAGWSDDSSGYLLLEVILARASGRPFVDQIRQSVIRPIELEETDFCPRESWPPGYADDCKQLAIRSDGTPASAASGLRWTQSLCSDVKDLFRWQVALANRALLDEETSRLMVTPGVLSNERSTGAGFATTIGRLDQFELQGHTGGVEGFAVRLAYYPEARVTIAVLANCATARVEEIEQEIARAMLGLLPARIVDLPVDPAVAERCAGAYQIATTRVSVFVRDGKLWYEEPTQPAFPLLYQGQRVFAWSVDKDPRLVFALERDGPAESFQLTRAGLVTIAQRME